VVTSADQEVPQYADLESSLLRPPTTPKQVAELKNFKDKISSLLRSTSSAAINASSTLNKSKQVREEEFFKFLAHLNCLFVVIKMLDDDLVAYLSQERNNKSLRDMGYFNKDDFLNFS